MGVLGFPWNHVSWLDCLNADLRDTGEFCLKSGEGVSMLELFVVAVVVLFVRGFFSLVFHKLNIMRYDQAIDF